MACGHCGSAVAVPDNRLAPAAVVGDFVLREELGRGGMGTVYLAHQISLDRDAAVKILHPEFAADERYTASFLREARAAAHLNHPSIVQAFAVGEDDGVHYFAMEYVEGSTLKQVLVHSGRMVPERALAIVTTVAEALEFGWVNQQLVHRDLKPDNIMLTASGAVKLADLGLARFGSENGEGSGEVHGTPQYISPEQLLGRPAQSGADIYSLGATFYHMLSGDFPYSGSSAVGIAEKHLAEPLRPLSAVVPDVPAGLAQIVEVMMAKRPAHRYADVSELLVDLRRASKGESPLRQVHENSQDPIYADAVEDLDAPPEATAAKAASSRKSLRLRNAPKRADASTAPPEPDEEIPQSAEEEPAAAALAEEAQSQPPRRLAGLIVAFLLLLAAGGGAAWYVLRPGSDSSASDPAAASADQDADELARVRQMRADGATAPEVAAALSEFAAGREFAALGEEFWELAGPVIEGDLASARAQAKDAQLAAWRDAQKRMAEEAEEARAKAEEQAARQAEEAARQEAARKEQERKAAEAAETVAKQEQLRWKAVELCRANDYAAASGLFLPMARDTEQPESAAWAKERQQCIAAAKTLYERIYNSKTKFAGATVPVPARRTRWTVTFVGPKTIDGEMLLPGKGKQPVSVELAAPNIEEAINHMLVHLKKVDQTVDKERLDREFGAFLVSRARYLAYAKKLLEPLAGTKGWLAEIDILAAKENE